MTKINLNTTPNPKFYLVGGAVRNFLSFFLQKDESFFQALKILAENNDNKNLNYLNSLKKLEKLLQSDLDILVVGGQPELFKSKGFSTVGLDFPIFLHPNNHLEYALARTERKNGRGYHGFECYSAPDVTIEEDLKRRDFTINAMAVPIEVDEDLNPKNLPLQLFKLLKVSQSIDLIDPYDGLQDLQNKKLKHISHSFSEDPLRILRLARFAAQYGFTVDASTIELIKSSKLSQELNTISAERFYTEWQKALNLEFANDWFAFLNILEEVGALAFLYDLKSNLEDDSEPNLKIYLQEREKSLKAVSVFLKNFLQQESKTQAQAQKNIENLNFEILQNLNNAWPLFDYLFFISKHNNLKLGLELDLELGLELGFKNILKTLGKRLCLPKKIEKHLQIYFQAANELDDLLFLYENIKGKKINDAYLTFSQKILNLFNLFDVFHHASEIEHLLLFIKSYLLMKEYQENKLFININLYIYDLYNSAQSVQAKMILMQKPELKGAAIKEALSEARIQAMVDFFKTNPLSLLLAQYPQYS